MANETKTPGATAAPASTPASTDGRDAQDNAAKTKPAKKKTAEQMLTEFSQKVAVFGRRVHGQDTKMHERLSGSIFDMRETHLGIEVSYVSAGTTELYSIPLKYGVLGFTAADGAKYLAIWAEIGEAIKAERAK